MEKFMDI